MKEVCQLDEGGYFIGATTADESPLEKGVYLMPAGAVDVEPPTVPDGKRAKYVDGVFEIEGFPEPEPPPEPVPPTDEEIAVAVTSARGNAYRNESDPIFFKFQRGEATQEEWLAKVEEIKLRFPDGVWPYKPIPSA